MSRKSRESLHDLELCGAYLDHAYAQNLAKPPFTRICCEFENCRDLRALSGKFLWQKSCYQESFRFYDSACEVYKVHKIKKTQMVKKCSNVEMQIMFIVLRRKLSFKPSVRGRQAHIFALSFSDISWKKLIWCKFCPISLFCHFKSTIMIYDSPWTLLCWSAPWSILMIRLWLDKENYWQSLDSIRLTWLMWPR